jgi:hypothetical protein
MNNAKYAYQLTITTEHRIPEDVLMEHLGYAIREGIRTVGAFGITIVGARGVASRDYEEENR